MYSALRPLLFLLDAETSHHLALGGLRAAYQLPGVDRVVRGLYGARVPQLPITLMGLPLTNPIGLAAGLDKDARYIAPLSDLGFGWLELGTVTPRPQPGNPKKRLFRLVSTHALINRMGFNNDGVEACLARIAAAPRRLPIGINIGKNAATPIERAAEDYLFGLRAVYDSADYVTVNISSPNTARLRELQSADALDELLGTLAAERARLAAARGRRVPIALKVAPDLDEEQITAVARLVLQHGFDAVIATNTTLARPGLEQIPLARETGGLSGVPLRALATRVVAGLYRELQGRVPIIGVGGIDSAEAAWDKLVAGADAIQIYTGLIYRGPELIRAISAGLARRVRAYRVRHLADAVALARRGHSSDGGDGDTKSSQKTPTLCL